MTNQRRIGRSPAAFVMLAAVIALACSIARAEEPARVTVVGTNYCLGCTLKKEKGAGAQCSIYGHRHALKVEKATAAGGADVAALPGTTVHYLDTDQSKDLVAGTNLHGKRVEVTGKLYSAEHVIEVESVRETEGAK